MRLNRELLMMSDERFVKVLDDEVYYLVDLEGLKPFSHFLDVIKESYPDYDADMQYELACDDYSQYLYEHSMTCNENLKLLNEQNKTIQILTAKIDRILHQRDGNEKQHLKVMSYLHDNYYTIWEECLKELGD